MFKIHFSLHVSSNFKGNIANVFMRGINLIFLYLL